MAALLPNPKQFRSVQEWAAQLYEFLNSNSRNVQQNTPLPVLLAHQLPNTMPRATTDGVLMYKSLDNTAVMSYSGKWVPVAIMPSFTSTQIADASHAVNTDGKVAGKLIFDSTEETVFVAQGVGATDTWLRLATNAPADRVTPA